MKLFITFILTITFSVSLVYSQISERKFVSINNKKMAYKTFGIENRKINEPIVVFESGLGSGGGSYGSLFPFIEHGFAGIVYDRNGIGESEIDSLVRTDIEVVKRLHDLLSTLTISPPYLLVGHSIGGPFIRLYAAQYPDEVCGLFFIDPTDFMLTKEEDDQVKSSTASKTGYRELLTINFKNILKDPSTTKGFRYEVQRELQESTPDFFKNYTSLPPLIDIPVTVMISYHKHIEQYETTMNENLKLGINLIPWWKELDDLSHGIHHQDPKLVAQELVNAYETCLRSYNKI